MKAKYCVYSLIIIAIVGLIGGIAVYEYSQQKELEKAQSEWLESEIEREIYGNTDGVPIEEVQGALSEYLSDYLGLTPDPDEIFRVGDSFTTPDWTKITLVDIDMNSEGYAPYEIFYGTLDEGCKFITLTCRVENVNPNGESKRHFSVYNFTYAADGVELGVASRSFGTSNGCYVYRNLPEKATFTIEVPINASRIDLTYSDFDQSNVALGKKYSIPLRIQ